MSRFLRWLDLIGTFDDGESCGEKVRQLIARRRISNREAVLALAFNRGFREGVLRGFADAVGHLRVSGPHWIYELEHNHLEALREWCGGEGDPPWELAACDDVPAAPYPKCANCSSRRVGDLKYWCSFCQRHECESGPLRIRLEPRWPEDWSYGAPYVAICKRCLSSLVEESAGSAVVF